MKFLDFIFELFSFIGLIGNGNQKTETEKEAREHFKRLK